MTDRELLELAAKAYWGDEIDDVCSIRYDESEQCICFIHGDNQDHNGLDREYAWDPLTDDGDALRLAVALQLHVCNEQLSAGVVYCSRQIDPPNSLNEQFFPEVKALADDGEVLGPADYAATRRAIVLAAAEIQQAKEAK